MREPRYKADTANDWVIAEDLREMLVEMWARMEDRLNVHPSQPASGLWMKIGTLRAILIKAIDSSPLNPETPVRFSLRTLLIGTMLLALALGGFSYYLTHRPPATPPIDTGDFGRDID